jgi:ATP-dependent RNA helicase DeaD
LLEPREHRLLRTIEQLTRQKIDVVALPTVADLKARRLEITKASVREHLVAADFADVRTVVESLAGEFDVMDIAAAAIKMAHVAAGREGDEKELEAPPPVAARQPFVARGADRNGPRRAGSSGRGGPRRQPHDASVRLFVGAGRRAGVRPADLVGAIAGETGVPARALGAIEIADAFSLVSVPEELADEIIGGMKKATLRGQPVKIRRDREDSVPVRR